MFGCEKKALARVGFVEVWHNYVALQGRIITVQGCGCGSGYLIRD